VPARSAPSTDPAISVFQALAHPARRTVIERLGHGPATVGELARPFDMALPSFVQHLRMLEAAGLVRSHKTGRVRIYALAPGGLRDAEGWLARQRTIWERRLDQFDDYVTRLKETP
jgi:DNA-binding transcriptional ArsR family regulator